MNRLWGLATAALLLGPAGCESPGIKSPAPAVGVQAIAPGPAGGRIRLFAATSLAELQAMVWASGSTPSFNDCIADRGAIPACWWKVSAPAESLYLAAALNTSACSLPAKLSAGLVGPSRLLVTADHGSSCQPHANAAAGLLTLLAIPISELPPLTLDIDLVHPGAPAAGGSTLVDLRRPLDAGGDPDALSQQIRNAYVRAADDAGRRFNAGFVPAGFAIRRWSDTGVGCPASGERSVRRPVHGYVVRMIMVNDPRRLTVEYHGTESGLVFCSSSGPPSPPPSPWPSPSG